MMFAIETRELCCSIKGRLIIDHISLKIASGEIFGILGISGAGKTTILDMMSGLIIPDSGTLYALGYHMPYEARQVHCLLGVVQQGNTLYEELTVWDNMVVYADILGIDYKKKQFYIDRALTLVQLLTYRYTRVSTFSIALKRRLALACALLSNPPLLYLDELTADIDVQERAAIWDYVRALHMRDRTIVIATRSFEEACTLCDRIAIIDAGRLLVVDTPEQLRRCYGDIVVELELCFPCMSVTKLQKMSGVQEIRQHEAQLTIIVQDSKQTLPQIIEFVAQESEIKAIRVRELYLAEILFRLKRAISPTSNIVFFDLERDD